MDSDFKEFRVWKRTQVGKYDRFLPFTPAACSPTLTSHIVCPSAVHCMDHQLGLPGLCLLGGIQPVVEAAGKGEGKVRLAVASPCDAPGLGRFPLWGVPATMKVASSVDPLLLFHNRSLPLTMPRDGYSQIMCRSLWFLCLPPAPLLIVLW